VIVAEVLPSEVVVMIRQNYADVADHTAVGGERDLRVLSGIVAAAESIPAKLIPQHVSSRLIAVIGTVRSAVRAWERDSRRHHITGREIHELQSLLEQCPDSRKWIERHDYRGYILCEPRPKTIDEIRTAMAEVSAIMASCQGAGAPAYDQAHVIWNMLNADLQIELARSAGNEHDNRVQRERYDRGQGVHRDPALTDTLVPIANRRAFDSDCSSLIERCQASDRSLGMILFDIDHFKQVNDDHGGHATGDEVLKCVAEIAAAVVEGKGTAYRYGGDEFAVLLPNHTVEEAVAVAERLRAAANARAMTSQSLTVSLSLGVAAWPTDGAAIEVVVKAADTALYDAKNAGRNRVRRSPLSPELIKQATRSLDERLVIGANIGTRTDSRGIAVHDVYLPVTNLGEADSFAVQVVEINPIDPPVVAIPWFVRWEGLAGETAQILKDVTRLLYLCETDLTGDIHDRETGRWRPGRLRCLMPSGEKELFISTRGLTDSSQLIGLRVTLMLKVTALKSGEVSVRKLTVSFNDSLAPEIVTLQPH
jgi:diguanylate cyclase (GGDEF)-like protein